MYDEVKCCVRINGFHAEWFEVKCGLKQGCSLSTLLFNLYINVLITHIKAFNVGTGKGHEKVAVMLYADGLILGKGELELQWHLYELGKWCAENKEIEDESKMVYFRTKSAERTNFSFKCNETELETITQYTGIGYLLSIKQVFL